MKKEDNSAQDAPQTTDLSVIGQNFTKTVEKMQTEAETGLAFINEITPEQLKETFSKLKTGVSITAQYLGDANFAAGECKKFMYLKATTMQTSDSDEPLPAVMLMDEDKNMYVNASCKIVGSLAAFKPPLFCEIVYKGLIRNNGKTIKDYQVNLCQF